MLIVDTNYGSNGIVSAKFYTHFALLKSLEAGFRLPCLNHACDSGETVMSDLFAGSSTIAPAASTLAAPSAGLHAIVVSPGKSNVAE